VTLTGAVDWQYQRKAAEDDIRKLSGVRGVLNGITIKDRPHVSDIKKKIEDALKRNAQVEANDIHIDIHDGAVTLKGKVQSWHERELLESAVWTVPGVKSIRDCVTVE
jgi:osmotically-inducible protein OsmY